MGFGTEGGCGRFSDRASRFCDVSAGRARLWDSGVGEAGRPLVEFTPEAHLATRLDAFVWLTLDTKPVLQKQKNRKRKSSIRRDDDEATENTHVAFGTSNGKLLVYSVALGKVETVLEDSDSRHGDASIVCVDWNSRCGLYTCSSDSTIKEWSIVDNAVKRKFNMKERCKNVQSSKTTTIKLVSDKWNLGERNFLLTAACQLRLWCLRSETVLRTLVGHTNDVCHLDVLCFPEDNRFYALSGSKNDRILSFWCVNISQEDLNGTESDSNDNEVKESKRRHSQVKSRQETEVVKAPSCNFLMEDIPRQVSCKLIGDNRSKIKLSVVTRSGVIHYYEHTPNGVSTKPVKPSVTVQLVIEDKNGSVIPNSIICSSLTEDSILLGYNRGFGMIFESVVPNTNEKVQVLLRSNKETEMTAKDNLKKISESATKIHHADDVNPSVVYLSSDLGRTDQTTRLKRPREGKKVDVPMESRLANLTLDNSSKKSGTDTKNMAQLLVQALHSKDTKLLQTIFECTDKKIAESTLNQMPIQYVSSFLDHLIELLSGKTSKCRSACIWADALCKAKSSALLSLGSVGENRISGLRSALAARVPTLPALLGLRSRLVLTLHRMSESENTPVSQEPLLDYKDTSSEDEMNDDMDEALLNNAEEDSTSWNDEEESDAENENNEENSSAESNQGSNASDDGDSD